MAWQYCRGCDAGINKESFTFENVAEGLYECPHCHTSNEVLGITQYDLIEELTDRVKVLEQLVHKLMEKIDG